MSREHCEICLFVCCFTWFVPLIIICLFSFPAALLERKKIDTYVKTDCLVTNSSLETCGVRRTKNVEEQCFRLSWQIEYVKYQNYKQTTITCSEFHPKTKIHKEDELKIILEKYQVIIEYNAS